MGMKASPSLASVAWFVLEKNILLGNTLSMKRVDERGKDRDDPIVFTEWKFPKGKLVKRRDFDLSVLLRADEKHDLFETANYREIQGGENGQVVQPRCLREYPPIDYRKLSEEAVK